jgi:uncharacterized protein YndB with AHSA1/START domain
MNDAFAADPYGTLETPETLRLQRRLPGPIERVWAYLTDSDLRRQWLAAGVMDLTPGAPFELVWRNAELSDPPTPPPEGFSQEHRLQSRVIAAEAPRRLVIAWGTSGEVTFTLEPQGGEVLLTLVHHRFADRASMLNICAGWHMHLDVLAARAAGREIPPFWSGWLALKEDYTRRIPA